MDNPQKFEFLVKQFKFKNFLLNCDVPHSLGRAVCGKHHIPYIIYKSGWCAWWLGFITYYLITYESGIKFAVYQTHWNLILQCLGSILQLCSAVHAWRWYKPSDEKNTPLLYKLNWVVFTVSSVFAFLVTLVYWTVLYKGDTITFGDVTVHLINSTYVLMDIFIIGIPVRILHIFLPTIYGIIYLLFTVFHFLSGGDAIYTILDWKDSPCSAVALTLILSMIGVPILHLILFFLYWIRMLIYTVCFDSKDNIIAEDFDKHDIENGSPANHIQIHQACNDDILVVAENYIANNVIEKY